MVQKVYSFTETHIRTQHEYVFVCIGYNRFRWFFFHSFIHSFWTLPLKIYTHISIIEWVRNAHGIRYFYIMLSNNRTAKHTEVGTKWNKVKWSDATWNHVSKCWKTSKCRVISCLVVWFVTRKSNPSWIWVIVDHWFGVQIDWIFHYYFSFI